MSPISNFVLIADDSEFIDNNLAVISDLRIRVLSAQENLQKIRDLTSSWSNVPLYQGKEGKFDCLIPLKDQNSIKETRYREILNISTQVLHLVAVSNAIVVVKIYLLRRLYMAVRCRRTCIYIMQIQIQRNG